MRKHFTIPATLEAVSRYTETVESEFADLPLPTRASLALAMQELGVNIVKHAYDGVSGEIQLTVERTTKQIAIDVRDYAPNGFTPPDTIQAPDPLDLPESGMGLFIIYQSWDEVQYERLANGNRWSLKKRLE